ncbi:MAG: YebC/PmpR family DNA-binding transcriptional regulator [Gammaproteobacteria bacterium]|nr:YebC/PmpR family DNA-binding transcriptional regulator [Gammaproteobacteria bacterium]
MGRGPSIEHRKNAADAQKARVFTKLIREITVAARKGGGDPAANPRLRLAIDRALDANVPKDTIERASKRAAGELGADQMQEVRYEGYAAGGIAIMVDCMTDNPTRTVADVRHALSKHGGHLGTGGSVAFQFTQTGELWFKTGGDSALEDRILGVAIEAGADDVASEEGYTEVLCQPGALPAVKAAVAAAHLPLLQADVVMRPATRVTVSAEAAQQLGKLIAALEALDDVQAIHHNADLPEAALA